MRKFLSLTGLFLIIGAGYIIFTSTGGTKIPAAKKDQQKTQEELTIIAQDLEIPWALAFLPDGNILFTERPGRLKFINLKKVPQLKLIDEIDDVSHIGEGGLLGVAIDPQYQQSKFIYLYYTFSSIGEDTLNRVVRFKFDGKLTDKKILIDNIPGASNHNGGRLKFGPDEFLYITTGDAQNPSLAQDKNSLAGKILRVTKNGEPVPGNPFGNLVYSYGHRNPQGLTWDDKKQLWSTEHGPLAHDELNLIKQDGNYGWPTITGNEQRNGLITPAIQSGIATWAPAGASFLSGSVFFGGLRGTALFEAKIDGENITTLNEHFRAKFGRIREVIVGPDGFLYITTSNRDGRGVPLPGDDKIIRIDPAFIRI
jgi:glucose/arabinose dehydrogenase